MERRALIISDSRDIAAAVEQALAPLGFETSTKQKLAQGIKSINGNELIFIDLPDAASAVGEIKAYHLDAVVIVIAAERGCDEERILGDGAFDCLERPPVSSRLRAAARNAHRYMSLRQELRSLKSGPSEMPLIIGRSPAMLRVMKQIRALSAKDVPALVCGEEGTGKRLAARAMHSMSRRRAGPFLSLDAPDEKALFGTHSDGRHSPGKTMEAEGGSLYIEGPPTTEGFIRFVSEGWFCPSGGGEKIRPDVRVMCAVKEASHESLVGAFNGSRVEIPPLRERAEDILPLAEHFLRQAGETLRTGNKRFSQEAKRAVSKHHWPGNVRELKSAVKRAYILAKGEKVEKFHLGLESGMCYGSIRDFLDEKLKGYIKEMAQVENSNLYDTVVSEVEKALIGMALKETDGNQIRAAKALGMNRNTLRAKIKTYGIKTPSRP